ncbi:MAG TPA: tetratricopeptide repeat protein [Terriglobales bacterium]|jgi:CHAT domain-containing protein/Tfp pilus assembly protein PilF|nr:tetratricopeptide repeat protein [Terriglobales bacterium]
MMDALASAGTRSSRASSFPDAPPMLDCFSSIVPRGGVVVRLLLTAFLVLAVLSEPVMAQQNNLPAAEAEIMPGVVVEQIVPHSESEQGGLHEGDVLLSWSRGDDKGEIASPFDLSWTEIEQAPLGTVKLEGLRGTEKQVWSLGPSDWGLRTRPNFSARLLTAYQEAQELAKSSKPEDIMEAARRWRKLADQYPSSQAGLIPAWLFFHAAESLQEARQWKEADDCYQSAVQHAAAAGPVIEGQLLQTWAKAYQQRRDLANAEKYFEQSTAKIESSTGGGLAIAVNLNALGRISWQRGQLDRSEEYLRRALQIGMKQAPGSLDVATSLNNLGVVARKRGDLAAAEQYCRQGFEIREKQAPGSLDVADSLNGLGILAWQRGDLAVARQYDRQALEIREKQAPGSLDVAASLNNLGILAWKRGDLAEAEQYYRQALEIQEKQAPGSLDMAGMLSNLGVLANERGDLAEAEQYYRQALEIQEKQAPGSLDVALSLDNLGNVAEERGDLVAAEQYHRQALEIRSKRAPGSLDVATSLINLGTVEFDRGDLAQAEQHEQQAFAIYEKWAPDSVEAAVNIGRLGDVTRKAGDLARAEQYYRRAVAIQEKLAPGGRAHAEFLAAVASVLHEQGQLQAAAQFYAQAITALESQTARLGGSEENRSAFRAGHSDIYRDYVDLLLEQKQPARALEVLERYRARTLLETLAAAKVDIHKGANPSLLERERSLQELLAAKSDRRLRLLGDKKNEKQVAAFTQEIEDLDKQYQEVEEQLRQQSPGYAALTQPQPLTASQIQLLLDPDSLLLEYSLGKERSYVFAVTAAALSVYELPKRAEIESASTTLYGMLSARNTVVRGGTTRPRQARSASATAGLTEALARFSGMVLGPVASQIQGKRLLMVGDGALQYIPFSALSKPESKSGNAPLIAEHEIVNLPSASTLAVLRREASHRDAASKEVMILADPVFDLRDQRVRDFAAAGEPRAALPAAPATEDRASLERSASDVGISRDGVFSRLLFSRLEAQTIYSTAAAGTATEALDFDANKAAVLSSKLANYRIVHMATHGFLDSQHPELSGLVFSLYDHNGRAQDGFLRLSDVYNLELNADLVVLSACQTALGKQVDGEGLISLSRGFMYAGSPRVIASLWAVDDDATAVLMGKFYQGLLQDHETPAQALRTAQRWMYSQRRWKTPYYWAGFVLLGEWR